MARILGIDPGSQRTGVGLIDVDAAGKCSYVHCQALNLLQDTGDFPARLGKLVFDLEEVLAQWRPDVVAIESVFMDKSATSALKLGHARGAAIATVVRHGLPVHEYAPRLVKQSLVGGGAAEKAQVQHMVRTILDIGTALQMDASDALALGLCHSQARRLGRLLHAAELTETTT